MAEPTPIHPDARRYGTRHPVTPIVWHDFVRATRQVWFDTTLGEWRTQLARLTRAGAHPISLPDLASYLRTGRPLPPPGACLLCFDDNTSGIFDIAAPALRKRRWPFVVSAHTAYIGIRTGKPHNSYEILRSLEQDGATIVSQTHTHPADLRRLSTEALTREFVRSRDLLARNLGHSVPYVTYPSGKWDDRVTRAAAAAGYLLGLTEDYGAAETSPHTLAVHRFSSHRRFDEAVRAIARSAENG
ncbi:MAG: polysaccharide deacetylase family protein [Capsulimonadales bacterium]|nr:polysaccharide deacetylase family protein [Capsulimonadales bacterium]